MMMHLSLYREKTT
uniref:Uncharacterized protein n=1 Tax=Arundo donax TaxID=35708 RepID=A0A0A9FU01_ARUDO